MADDEKSPSQEFARLLSHQMKAPVHAINSLLNALYSAHGEEIPPAVRDTLDRVNHRAEEAGHIVDDLLEYVSYQRGDRPEGREFEIVDLLQEIVLRFSSSAGAKDIAIGVSIAREQAVFVRGSRPGLEHAVRNLIDNAVKYTPKLGRIEISLETDEKSSTARIGVRDSGEGIPKEELDQLFRPFFRSKSRVGKTGGSGLGLAIAQSIAAAHDGRIEVASEVGAGTTFTIVLPVARIEHTAPPPARRRVVIVGGVTSGPRTAARLRRLDEELDITIVERNEFLSYPGCQLPYFISNRLGSSQNLLSSAYHTIRTAHFFETLRNIHVLNMTTALKIDRTTKKVTVRSKKDGEEHDIPYDLLVLSTGSSPTVPPISEAVADLVFTLHSLEDAKRIRDRLNHADAQDVIIIGAGLIGVAAIQPLLDVGARVTLVEKEATILSAYFDPGFSRKIEEELRRRGVKIATNTRIDSISHASGGVAAHAADHDFSADFVVFSSGMKPNTELARSCGLEIGETGGIRVDEHLRTSDPSIFAVGDSVETRHLVTKEHEYWPLGSVSVKMGRTAADVIAGRDAEFRGSIGTLALSCAGLYFARTGLTSERAAQSGYDPVSFVITGRDRPSYVGQSEDVYLKVIADRGSRRVIGAQAIARIEVASKISLYATAIVAQMTTDDVFRLDLGHAPDFNLPIDLVQVACMMLNNKMDGLIRTVTPEELADEPHSPTFAVITNPDEDLEHLIPGSLEVTPENIRKGELPFGDDEEVVLYSKSSMEAYQAYRILVQRRFDKLRVLEGGILYWGGGPS